MPDHIPLALPKGLSIKKTRHLPIGADVSFEIVAQPGTAALTALATNAPFPSGPITLDSASVKVSGERTIPFASPKGTVTFSGKADAYQRLSVLDEPVEITALLARDQLNEDLAAGLAIEKQPGHRFIALRWGYHLQGAAKGSIALGAGPTVKFGAEANRLGAYAVVRQIPDATGAATAVADVFDSWMLPSQFNRIEDLAPGTWIVTEVDGSIALKLGAQYGYDFNWVREAVTVGELSGDIGLKVQVGLEASFGFEASGQYAIALARPLSSNQLRLQLFRLNRKGLNLAFSASASAKASFGGLLPDHFDEFIEGVFGLHGLQILKELDTWTAPDRKLSDLLAGVGVGYAEDFLTKVTGIDAKTTFDSARTELLKLLAAWHELPHKVASTVYSLVEHQLPVLTELRAQLTRVADNDLGTFQPDLERLLSNVQFFSTPFGKWLESAVTTSALGALSNADEYRRLQEVAKHTLAVIDGGAVEHTLVRLQSELANRIGLTKVEQIVDNATFDKADEWLKARLAAFLSKKGIDNAQVQEIRAAIHKLVGLRQRFFEQAKKALTQKYELNVLASYQKATTRTALLDVVFDFAEGAATELNKLAAAAIDGDFDQLLFNDIAGVSLRKGVLTHEVKRQSHLDVSMPFLHVELDHINTSLAKLESVQSDTGRIVIYDLHAEDLKTAKGRFASRFTIHGRFVPQRSARVFDDVSMTQAYSFRQALPMVRTAALTAQLGGYVETYFPTTFGGGRSSFADWIADLDRTIDGILQNGPNDFGNTLLRLDVSVPAACVGAWALAPDSADADAYRAMSVRIQEQLRKLIPLQYFQDLERFNDRVPSAALLVYASLPATTGIVVQSGRIVQFDDRRDVYPDIDTSGNIEVLVHNSRTLAALVTRLASLHAALLQSPETAGIAGEYQAAHASTILSNALTPNGRADLDNLLRVERGVIREAHAAGLSIAKALKTAKPADALAHLAEYGAKVTNAFNSKIGSLFKGDELRPLGSLVFMEAGAALDATLRAVRPSALLELTILKEQPVFDLRSFVSGEDPPAAEIVNVQKFVSLT